MPDCYLKRGKFVILKHNLLSQHNVADREILLRQKTNDGDSTPALVELINIHLPVGTYAIALSAVRAPYLKIAYALILNALVSCQPLLEEGRGALFSFADPRIAVTAAWLYPAD